MVPSSKVTKLEDGTILRTFEITAINKEIEIAPGVFFPAWTYNGHVPGPTLRATEGERIRITFKKPGRQAPYDAFSWFSCSSNGRSSFRSIGPAKRHIYL